MEGMDLWTSMFSADLEEDEEEIEQYANENGLDSNPAGDSDDILPEEDDDEEEEGEGRTASGDGKTKEPDLDDDAIFDFDLEPIVSIGESQPPPQLALTDPPETSVRLSGVVTRPTTSQINATDANGVPINYELGVIYICPACGEEFRQQDLWKRHMNQMHQFNTRRGLNFMAMDKLYHRCLECNKRIAMHSRENLLKHKFTHLPFRCTKCYICKREYKYRQDLMVHLRMVHCDEVVAMMREGFNLAGRKTRVREPRTEQMQRKDPFPEENDDRNDILEPEVETMPAMVEGEAPQRRRKKRYQGGPSGDGGADLCEDYIHYMCPDCGTECDTHAQWSQHIEFVHDYVSRRGLNFISVDMQMQCLECKKIVIPNTIKTLRAHKFTHLPQPEWLRCKLCYKGYREHHELVTHLLKQHQLESLMPEESPDTSPVKRTDGGGDDWEDHGMGNGSAFDDVSPHFEDVPRRGGRIGSDDIYEPHIDYLCPQCGKEFIEKKHWRTHVVQVHGMNDVTKLNFAIINDRQLKCTECAKIITNAYGIQNAQQHRITHLPFKAYARCRKCHKSYTDRKGLVKHLATYHRVGYVPRKNLKMGGRGARLFESPKQQRKQIVTLGKETYEIIFLDEEQAHSSVDEENDFGEQMQMPDEDDLPTVSAGLPPPNPNRYKCVECGTLFPTQVALKLHISEAHALRDPPPYGAPKKMEKNLGKEDALRKRRLGSAEALIPSAAAAAATSGPSAGTVEQNYIFLCPSCGEEYKTQFEWRRHINEAHNFDKRQYLNMRQLDKYRYQCTQCNDIVCNSKLKGLQDHHFRHLPFRLYLKCLVCGTCYNHKPNIAAHLRTRHNVYERETPWRELQTKPQYSYVQAKEKDRDTVAKSRPPKSPAPPPAVVASSSGSSVGSRPLWPQSEKRPTRPAGLNTLEDSISYHNAVDMDFITYYCPKCNKNFDSHAFWRKHIVEHHNFNSREGLNFRQIDIHHYLCLECYKRVTVTHTKGAIGQLQSHKFRHLPYRSFKCLTCNGEFVRKQMFFKHLNRDTNRCDNKPNAEKEFDDEEHETCGDASTEDADAEATAYRLMCPQCGDDFTTSSQGILRNHLNVTHGLGKQLLHIRKVGEGLYRCNDCDEELATKSKCVLQQHRFKHMPHAAYIVCQLCKSGTEEKAAELHSMRELHQHIHEHHPAVEVSDERVQRLRQLIDEEEEADEDSQPPENSGNGSGSTANNGPYMPLPPHLLDEVDDLDFEDQFLLGGC